MDFLARVRERAAQLRPRVAFPEGRDPRVVAAATELFRKGVIDPVLVATVDNESERDALRGAGLALVDPASDDRRSRVAADLAAYVDRKERDTGRQPSKRPALDVDALSRDPLVFADDMLRHGEVDACVAGCVYTTADVIRAALWLVGTAPGVRTVSSAFYMLTRDFRGAGPEVITFADCAVVPQPTPEQLADIALAAAHDRRRIVGDEPIVALLSYSSAGSAGGESVDRVRAACELVRAREPELRIDGELQGDAALIASIGARKAPGSVAAGSANVLIFPSLDAGNIAYKLVERIGGAQAIGPVLQGLAKPCSDLSRGASPDDIMVTAAVTVLQTAD